MLRSLILVVITFYILINLDYQILSNFRMFIFMNCSVTIVILLLLSYTINLIFFAMKVPVFANLFTSFLKHVSLFIGLTVLFSVLIFIYSMNPFVSSVVFFLIIVLCNSRYHDTYEGVGRGLLLR